VEIKDKNDLNENLIGKGIHDHDQSNLESVHDD